MANDVIVSSKKICVWVRLSSVREYSWFDPFVEACLYEDDRFGDKCYPPNVSREGIDIAVVFSGTVDRSATTVAVHVERAARFVRALQVSEVQFEVEIPDKKEAAALNENGAKWYRVSLDPEAEIVEIPFDQVHG